MWPLSRTRRRSNLPAAKPIQHAVAARLADDNLRDVLLPGHAQNAAGHVGIGRGDDFRAQFARQRQMLGQSFLVLGLASGCGCST